MSEQKGFIVKKELGYFQNQGVDVMCFDDIYPVGHQSGVSLIMHGNRLATNGDVRFEPTPGQWQPVPKQEERTVQIEDNKIVTKLRYPNLEYHLKGFNPIIYPDYEFEYTVTVQGQGDVVSIRVDLDKPIPEEFIGKMCFNMELFPGALFGKPWLMDDKSGVFPLQPYGPTMSMPTNLSHSGKLFTEGTQTQIKQLVSDNDTYNPIVADDLISLPYATGKKFIVCPGDPKNCFSIESKQTELKFIDGRMNHNNGWFVISAEIPAGISQNAVEWIMKPSVIENWMYEPVVQVSQVGYHTNQPKYAIIELDNKETEFEKVSLWKLTETGDVKIASAIGQKWGKFLRYQYLKFDFSDIKEQGLYQVKYGKRESSVFRIAEDVFERGIWQPVLEYFLPIQMCHMRVNEKYRVWHDLCHEDDARMAPPNTHIFDGYAQGPSTLTKYQGLDKVPGLNVGGWHDAGDFDLRVESQAGECYIMAMAYEAFGVDYDVTTIDQTKKITEIHQPDGKNDLLQQIEHGALSVVGSYRALGRLYRGIITHTLRQYVLMGDPSAMTDGIQGNEDDRWVFTEDNPLRELNTAGQLAAVSRVLKGFNETLSEQALEAAKELYEITKAEGEAIGKKIFAATELFLTTKEEKYKDFIIAELDYILANLKDTFWFVCRVIHQLNNENFMIRFKGALVILKEELNKMCAETPYGILYRPYIWGAGWMIQGLAFQYYFLYKAFPDLFGPELIFNSLNFVLGCHPGQNTSSFASGVGTKSVTAAYGLNRGDWSYIPGGVVSGTALIRPDFPELLDFPFLWQQTEYVLGGGSSNYMFMVLAAQSILEEEYTIKR